MKIEPVEFQTADLKVQNIRGQGGYRLHADIPSHFPIEAATLMMAGDVPGLIATFRVDFKIIDGDQETNAIC